jgi:hypothetical protein
MPISRERCVTFTSSYCDHHSGDYSRIPKYSLLRDAHEPNGFLVDWWHPCRCVPDPNRRVEAQRRYDGLTEGRGQPSVAAFSLGASIAFGAMGLRSSLG